MAFCAVQAPLRTVVCVFALWKAVLLLIAVGSLLVGPAYDTSASLSLLVPPESDSLLSRLSSWDAVYFVHQAHRGYVFEQEWAFGGGLALSIRRALKALNAVGLFAHGGVQAAAAAGVIVAHVFHLLSSLALFWLGLLVLNDQRQALVAACLHVVSPAGLFLSAPYAESGFSFMSFSGLCLFALGQSSSNPALAGGGLKKDAAVLLSGMLLGRATTFRSNGVLCGIPIAYAFARDCIRFASRPSLSRLRRVVVLGIAGLCIAAGFFGPQAIAYSRYCRGLSEDSISSPEWCGRTVPSIYSFVQQRYWGVGFLRYWNVPNIPLFLLAAPMLYLMLRSGREVAASPSSVVVVGPGSAPSGETVDLLRSLAASQATLAFLALTSYHVQIITRLSSGYPVWYWWLAKRLGGNLKEARNARGWVTFMVLYAAIQAVLFSSFLPPA